uniref:Uncharacterized protein n=1 Tax=Globisporangium ultimum (strain ATCC 200006 / CBS 805.95 / DAOM BR144) TaxID=431595 RepID=K3WD42_GLOUD
MLSTSPAALGDACLGQICKTMVHLVEHVIPALHRYLSWDLESNDLGPIIPELSAPLSYPTKRRRSKSPSVVFPPAPFA